ncbi:MAG: hypothetical protein EAZ39_27975 [Oscillatoriales cyanobacterium]|nr:MAG: hypothetical protein EAZ88_16445 [Oscillatoriales cyanobacterium]TAG13477.1 MAG: hypothetical protein EAZ39_27975 [Oscillatoriales cyanobacterium]TAG42096.1 MAG: hypothetical protein EAZ33_15975 [Oscillatoriales cyanobacterium]TAG57654.1 MAG: hypothetical protein EAZ28_17285 [Oscillatoriales cyanobacterium]TAG67327.1 MAG: hypothetical protein EAZ25_08095 [Oscillatoriales cyanobacterium]
METASIQTIQILGGWKPRLYKRFKSSAVGNRVYTNNVRLRGLRNMEFQSNVRWLTPRYATTLQPAEAGFVGIDAVSTAGFVG